MDDITQSMLHEAVYMNSDDYDEEESTEEENIETVEETEQPKEENIDEIKEEKKDEEIDNDINIEIEEESEEKKTDEFIIPEKFDSPDDELKFYKENFTKIKDEYTNPEIVAEKYKEQLLSTEKDVEELKALNEMLKGSPDAFVKLRFKDELSKAGYNTQLSNTEIQSIVKARLSEVFGNNFADIYNEDDIDIPGTATYKMIELQDKIIKEAQEFNKPVENINNNIVSKEEAIKNVTEKLKAVGVKDENITRFIEKDIPTKGNELLNDPVRLYKAVYMDQFLKKEREKAYADGKKDALEEIKKASPKRVDNDEGTEEEDDNTNIYDYFK